LSLRTWQRCLLEGWTRFSERLPRMGTMRSGKLYQRPPWVRRTVATECSSLGPFATLTAKANHKGKQPAGQKMDTFASVADQKSFLDADATMESGFAIGAENTPTHSTTTSKKTAVYIAGRTMFLTPSANEDAAGTPNGKMQKMLGNHPDVRNTGDGTLNPQWVEWLMGFPDGWTDLNA